MCIRDSTTSVHNCPTSSEHYKSMMGQTINKITYYTSKGIYEVDADVYVPVKLDVYKRQALSWRTERTKEAEQVLAVRLQSLSY